MDKKGFLRIMEVMFAITILSTAIMYAYVTSDMMVSRSFEDYISIFQKEVLLDISNNPQLRSYALDEDDSSLIENINLPSNLNYTVRICELSPDEPCLMDSELYISLLNKEIYADETIIASNLTHYSPKRVRLFIWEV